MISQMRSTRIVETPDRNQREHEKELTTRIDFWQNEPNLLRATLRIGPRALFDPSTAAYPISWIRTVTLLNNKGPPN
jgi:hypothetical protein